MSDCCIFDGKLIFTKYKIKLSGFIKYFCGKYTGTGGSLTSGSYCLTFKPILFYFMKSTILDNNHFRGLKAF